MRFLVLSSLVGAALFAPAEVQAQLPPGYWSYYDTNHQTHRRQPAYHAMPGHQPPAHAPDGPANRPNLASDPFDYNGRGMTGHGLSTYQSNGYSGSNQNLYYGYWDGGFQGGSLYGYSMYPHFNRPGFTYWQY